MSSNTVQRAVQLNAVEIKRSCIPSWKLYQIQLSDEEVWSNSTYGKIVRFRREFQHPDFLLESHGRTLAIIPLNGSSVDIVDIVEEQLTIEWEKKVKLQPIETPKISQDMEDKDYQAILSAVGGYFGHLLVNEYGFEKMSSLGNIGRFYHPSILENKILEGGNSKSRNRDEKLELRQTVDLSLHMDKSDGIFYLTLDLKTNVFGKENLTKLIDDKIKREGKRILSKDQRKELIDNLKQDQREWKIDFEVHDVKTLETLLRKFKDEIFILHDYLEKNNEEGNAQKMNLLKYDDYKDMTVKDFADKHGLRLSKGCKIAEFSIRTKRNERYFLPTDWFSHNLPNSSVSGKYWERDFHKFSKPFMNKRYQSIEAVVNFINTRKQEKNIQTGKLISKQRAKVEFVPLKARKDVVKKYGRVPEIWKSGVEEWGELREIIIFHRRNMKDDRNVTQFGDELKKQLDLIASKSGQNSISLDYQAVTGKKQLVNIAQEPTQNKAERLYLFLENREAPYSYVKKIFTQMERKPVQYIRHRNITGRFRQVVGTLIPQLITKTGGLPYALSENRLDNALIIGLDKARDSSSSRPSASAGVAAVTPQGHYVSGASTEIDNTKDDSIDVDRLAPQLLEHLDEINKKPEYVVILRDGAPAVCRPEVKRWKEYLDNYNLDFAFLSSRKENSFRIYPDKDTMKQNRPSYQLPIVVKGSPLQKDEFLTVTASAPVGTPKPVIYTMMENTTPIQSLDEIQSRIISQVVSMSMLAWESPRPTSQPLPLHYADKLANFTQMIQMAWPESNLYPMFI